MKELLNKLLKFIDMSKELGRQPYYIVEFNGIPILIRKDDLVSGISRTYTLSRDRIYIDKTPVDLHNIEMRRAEAKLSAQPKQITGE